MVPSLEIFVSLLQIWSECPQTSHHSTTATLNLRWNWKCYNSVATRIDPTKSKDATQSWVPRASTKALRCTEGDPTFAFRSATPLWSSIGQLQQSGRLNLVLPRSQRPPKLCPQAYSEAAQLVTYACTHDKRVQSQPKLCAQPVLNRQLATCTWDKNDRTSGIVYLCFYSYTLMAGNSATVLWVWGLKSIEIMAAFDEQLFIFQTN